MRGNSIWYGIPALALVFGLAHSAPAQEEGRVPVLDRGTHIVSGFLGRQFFDFTETFEDFNNEVNDEFGFGLRYQYQLTPRFGLEGAFLMSPVEHSLFTATGGVIGDRDLDSSYWTANGVWNFARRGRFFPFVTGGLGAVSLSVDDPNLEETDTSLLWNFGGGVMYAATENVMLRLDIRDYIYTMDEVDLDLRDALLLPADFDETISDLSITIGASYVF